MAGLTASSVSVRSTKSTPITSKTSASTWYYDLDTDRGQEATPVVVDGVMYITTAWSMVKAFDAKTGKLLWDFDPKVGREILIHVCCDAVNRGVAVWKGKVYVGTIDGRLIALDAATGKPVWSVQTTDRDKPYTITSAPRAINDKIVIGNSGSEYGVRGYMSAYDAATRQAHLAHLYRPRRSFQRIRESGDAVGG